MAEAFDPYYTWLGIPHQEQPPHHYRHLARPPPSTSSCSTSGWPAHRSSRPKKTT